MSTQKYPKPQILLMGLDQSVSDRLRHDGYNVLEGNFGFPYQAPNKRGGFPLYRNWSIPDYYTESGLVVIDLANIAPLAEPPKDAEIAKDNDGAYILIDPKFGLVDPRPIVMFSHKADIDQIYEDKGILVVFAGPKTTPDGSNGGAPDFSPSGMNFDYYSTWSFLSLFQHGIFTQAQKGREIIVADFIPKDHFLAKHLRNAEYTCTLQTGWQIADERWSVIASNKRQATVAALISPTEKTTAGHIIILPQVKDKAAFLSEALFEWFPNLAPHLFPDAKGLKWIQRREYKLPQVLDLEIEAEKIRTEAELRQQEMQRRIDEINLANKYAEDLITEADASLVLAVKRTLEVLGFQSVIEMDEERRKQGKPNREDLQIRDRSPLVLVEIKGVSGTGRESSTLQIWKYLYPTTRELGHTNVRGLAVLNHQKNLPPLERRSIPFSDDVVANANEHEFGLLTTWNLFKLLRNFQKFGWQHDQVADLFYRNGVIEPIPTHYEYLGEVEKYSDKFSAVGVRLQNTSLNHGERIAFEGNVEFEEQTVESLQLNGNPVNSVPQGEIVGIETKFSKDSLKEGTRVFRVKQE